MAGYTRQSAASIANGQIIEDYHFNNEFNQLEAAFSGSTGHAHDGSVGNGPKISLTASVDGVLPVANGGTGVTTLQGLNDALTSGSVFKDNTFIIADFADTTKRFRFEVSAVSPATTRTFTLPDADITISSYMGGLLNTANKADLQTALDIMAASVYDPNGVAGDAFDMDNMVEGITNLILTPAERADIAANTSARHTHSNKSVLDATDQAFTTALKSKLDGIEAGAQVNAVTSVAGKTGAVILNAADVGADLLSGFRNKIINGDFDIWQRGPGPFAGTTYTADRWIIGAGAGGNVVSTSRQSFSPGQAAVPGNPKHFLRFARTTTGTSPSFVNQYIEDVRTLAGRLVTCTFWAKADKALSVEVGYLQNFGSGGSADVEAFPETINVGTTWAKYSVTMTWPSVSGKTIGDGSYVAFRLRIPVENGNFTFDLAHVSVVEGDATAEDDPFSPRHIQQEMALCQRYFVRINGNTQWIAGLVAASAGSQVFFALNIPVTMRVTPTAGGGGQGSYSSGGWVSSNMDVVSIVGTTAYVTIDVPSAMPTSSIPGWLVRMADGNGNPAYITFDAEL